MVSGAKNFGYGQEGMNFTWLKWLKGRTQTSQKSVAPNTRQRILVLQDKKLFEETEATTSKFNTKEHSNTTLTSRDQENVAKLLEQKQNYTKKVEAIDSMLAAIQKSTRTLVPFMVPVHNSLRMRYKWYYNWHLFKYAKLFHWIILALYILGLGATVYFMVIQPMRYPKIARAATVTWAPNTGDNDGDTIYECESGTDAWEEEDCWDTGTVPTSSDDVVIGFTSPGPHIYTSAEAGSIDSNNTGTGLSGGTLTVSGNATFYEDSYLENITLNIGGSLAITGIGHATNVTVNMNGATWHEFSATAGFNTAYGYNVYLSVLDGGHVDMDADSNILSTIDIEDGVFDPYGYDISDFGSDTTVNIAADGTLELYGTSDQLISMGTNNGMVAYKGGSTYTGLAAGESYHDLKFFDLSGDYTLDANVDVTGDLENAYNLIDGAYEITVEGDYIIGTSAEGGGATVVLDGTGNQAIIASGGYSTNLEIDKASGDVSCDDTFEISVDGGITKGDLTITATGTGEFARNGSIITTGDFTMTDGTLSGTGDISTFGDVTGVDGTITGQAVYFNDTQTWTPGSVEWADIYVDTGSTINLDSNADINGNLTIDSSSSNAFATDNWDINIAGDWVNNVGTDGFDAGTGEVIFDGAAQATTGDTTFNDLTMSTNDQVISFAALSTTMIDGTWIVGGSGATDEVILQQEGVSGGTRWTVDLNGGSTAGITYVKVQDSLASPAITVTGWAAMDNGNNSGWSETLVGDTVTWNGDGITNDWSDADNWDTDTVPTALDDVVFDGTGSKDANVDAGFGGTINSLTITSAYDDASLFAGDIDLTVVGNFSYDQAETMNFSGKIYVGGDYTVANESTGGGTTIVLNGVGNQLITPTSGWIGPLEIDKVSGDVYPNSPFSISDSGNGFVGGSLTVTNTGTGRFQTNGHVIVCDYLTITAGTIEGLGGSAFSVYSDVVGVAGTLTSQPIGFDGATAQSWTPGSVEWDDVTINDDATVTLQSSADINGSLNITSAVLEAGSYDINIAGDWVNNVGTDGFDAGTGEVIFDGAAQATTGDTTFNDLTMSTNDQVISFAALSTTMIDGTWIVGGSGATDEVILQQEGVSGGDRWTIDLNGGSTAGITYVKVQDSLASPAITVTGWAAKDNGNNSGWSEALVCTFADGDGSPGDPFIIDTLACLQYMNNDLDASYKMGESGSGEISAGGILDASATSGWNGGDGFEPIGDGGWSTPFTGNFDGNGKTINNLYIYGNAAAYPGLFDYVSNSSSLITDFNLTNVDIDSTENGTGGAVVGWLEDGQISDVTVTGLMVAGAWSGGLVGEMDAGSISNSSSDIAITVDAGADTIGGLVGYVSDSSVTISDSHASGNITGGTSGGLIGGLVGDNSGVIDTCYTEGDITASDGDTIGGLTGSNYYSVIDSYALGNITTSNGYSIGGLTGLNQGSTADIVNSYALGDVVGNETEVGGLVGTMMVGSSVSGCYALGDVDNNPGLGRAGGLVGYMRDSTIDNSYAIGSVSSDDPWGNGVGGLIGRTAGTSGISYSYSTGGVTGVTAYAGFIGYNTSTPTYISNYWLQDTGINEGLSDISNDGDVINITATSTADMKLHATYVGWDFPTTWTLDEAASEYPKLAWQGGSDTYPVIVPDSPTVTVNSNSSINIKIIDNASDTYAIKVVYSATTKYLSTDGTLSDTEVWDTYANFGGASGRDNTSLSTNIQYTYSVAGKVGGTPTDYSTPVSKYTLANIPSAPTVNATSTTSLTAIININSNPAATEFAISCDGDTTFLNYTTNACEGIADNADHWRTYTDWNSGSGFADTGLSVNTQHTYKVIARNGDKTNTALSSGASKYTLSNVPTAPTLSNVNYSTITVKINVNSNPDTTQYVIHAQYGVTEKYVQTAGTLGDSESWASYTAFGGSSGVVITGLTPEVEYTFKVKAKNGDGTETAYSATAASTTISSHTITASAGANGSISPSGITTVGDGQSQSFTITPSTGYAVETLLVDGVDQGSVTSYTFTNIIADHTISATFVLNALTAPSGLAMSSITATGFGLTWTDNSNNETGFKIYISNSVANNDCANPSTTYPTTPSAQLGQNAVGTSVANLSVDTQYCAKISATNGVIDSAQVYTSTAKYTLANTLSRPNLVSNSPIRQTVSINPYGQNANSLYAMNTCNQWSVCNYLKTDGTSNGSAPVWATYTSWGGTNGVTINNLAVRSYHSYVVTIKNGDGVTASSTSLSTQTFTLIIPTSMTVSTTLGNPGFTGFHATWRTFDSSYSAQGYKLYIQGLGQQYPQGGCENVSYISSPKTFAYNVGEYSTGFMTPESYYCFKLVPYYETVDLAPVFSSVSNTRPSVPKAPIISDITETSMRLTIDPSDNYLSTKYYVTVKNIGSYLQTNGKFIKQMAAGDATVLSDYAGWGGSSGVLISNLTPGTLYQFEVTALLENSGTASSVVNATTLLSGQKAFFSITVTGDENAIINPSGQISVVEGGSSTIYFSAKDGYRVKNVSIDGNSQGRQTIYRFTNVRENHNVVVTTEPSDIVDGIVDPITDILEEIGIDPDNAGTVIAAVAAGSAAATIPIIAASNILSFVSSGEVVGMIVRSVASVGNFLAGSGAVGTATSASSAAGAGASSAGVSWFGTIWNYLLSLFGIRRIFGSKKSGRIVEYGTNMPVQNVKVEIYKVIDTPGNPVPTQKLVITCYSDNNGYYGAVVEPGRYIIRVFKEKYQIAAPSALVIGTIFEVRNEGESLVMPNVQLTMDAKAAEANIKMLLLFKKIEIGLSIFSFIALLIGTVLVIGQLFQHPTTLSYIMAGVYGLIWAFNIRTLIKKSPWGVVSDAMSNIVLPLTLIRVLDKTGTKLIRTAVSNQKGKYSVLIPKGEYMVLASRPGYDQAKLENLNTSDKSSIINKKIAMNKNGR